MSTRAAENGNGGGHRKTHQSSHLIPLDQDYLDTVARF